MIYNIFFVHKERGLNLLHHSFSGSKLDEDLVSGFISALISFIGQLRPPSKDYKKEKLIRTVDRGDFKIIIESGEEILGIIFVNIEKVELRTKLRKITQEFEEAFDLKNWDGTIEVEKFESFKEVIFKTFATEIIHISDVPIPTPLLKKFLDTHDEIDLLTDVIEVNLSVGLVELLMTIDGTSDVQEISNRLECPVEEAIEKIGYLYELGDLVSIENPVHGTDIFVLTPEAMPIFRLNTYLRDTVENLFGPEGLKILLNVDGSRSVQGIEKKTNIPMEKIIEVLRFCLTEQLIKQVRIHPIIRKAINLKDYTSEEELLIIFKKIARLCDGNHSLREIAKNLKVPISTITDFLVMMGEIVDWIKK